MALTQRHHEALEALYDAYTHRRFVSPDPLEALYAYKNAADIEVAALVASCLAYGRVAQIVRSVRAVLGLMGDSPSQYVAAATPAVLRRDLGGFCHRFNTAADMAALLLGARAVRKKYGSLAGCLAAGLRGGDVWGGLAKLSGELTAAGGRKSFLLSDPHGGGACKRLHLLLRWLVRRDRVDVGGWDAVKPGQLVVPLDTHMHRLALAMGLTARKSADARTAREVTAAYARLSPHDPVRYDFALTRLGIRRDMDDTSFLSRWHSLSRLCSRGGGGTAFHDTGWKACATGGEL
ncbi:MAG: TIGR02757 family protein [Planctomycetaceae bacterium]|nr:TIGR02757 family protein [Planctomycetaceae bacterium]